MAIPTLNKNYLACPPLQLGIICFNFHDITFFYVLTNIVTDNFVTLKSDHDGLLFIVIVNVLLVENGTGTWQSVISMNLLKQRNIFTDY